MRLLEHLEKANPFSLPYDAAKRDLLKTGVRVAAGLALTGPLIEFATACGKQELTPEQKVAEADKTLQEMAENIRHYQILQIGLQSADSIQKRPNSEDSRIGRTFYPNNTTIGIAELKINHPLFLRKLIQAVLKNNDDKPPEGIFLIQRKEKDDRVKIDFVFRNPASDSYLKIPYEVMMEEAAKHDIRKTSFFGQGENAWTQAVAKNPGIEIKKL